MKQSAIYVSLLWGIGLFLGSHCILGQPLRNIRFHPFTTLHGLPASEITSFSEADNGFLWITSIDGISCFDGARFKNYRLPLVDSTAISGSNHVTQILCWKKQVWCLNRQGHFFGRDPKSDVFVYMGFSGAKKESKQANKNYSSFCFDEMRNCFWTTEADSIVRIDLASGQKTMIWRTKSPITAELLLDQTGRIWFPTDAGEVCLDPNTKEATTFFQSSRLTTNGGLVRIDASFTVKKLIVPLPFKEKIVDIIPQGKDAFWIKGNSQAGLYWPQRNQYFPIPFPSKVNLFNMNIGQGQSVLFSTDSAVFRVKLADFDAACACFPKPQKVCSVLFPSDLIENDTAIWVDVPNGLAEFHKQKHVFRIFGEKGGLTNLRVRSILEDSQGQLWMNSDNGLFVCSPRYLRFKKYGETDGLADNFIPGILSKDGAEFHAGFDSRFSTFQPEERNHLETVKPLITDVFALNKRLPTDLSATEMPLVTIGQAQNILRFEFTCPDFYQPEKISFQYQLEGFDAAPVEAGTARTAVYTNLDGGSYRFLVWATNADGFRCETPAVVLLQVVPPFYKTWWFGVAVFALILGFIVALFKYREQQRIRQENTRLRIARDLHDEVGSTLSTISILSESVSRNVTADKDKIRLTGIGEKARSAMENMSDIVWAINPQNDSMPQIIQRMTAYASETLEAANITLQFTVGQGVEHIRISTEKRKDFYLFFKEAVANSAKHSHAQRVDIVLEKKDKRLLFQIADDGVGLPENIPTLPTLNGNGLTNMAARAKILQADFSMHRPQKGGVVVRLSIPI